MECPGGIRRIAHAALASQLSARSADRFERFTIKPPALPEVSDSPLVFLMALQCHFGCHLRAMDMPDAQAYGTFQTNVNNC
jgi:hypothetical protein